MEVEGVGEQVGDVANFDDPFETFSNFPTAVRVMANMLMSLLMAI